MGHTVLFKDKNRKKEHQKFLQVVMEARMFARLH
jgi:hypothetical protein